MRTSLCDFTADLLAESGAVVELSGEGLEVLLPAEVARILDIPEHANLSFLGERHEGISVSYDSEILKKMAGLMGDRGKFATVGLGPSSVRLEKLEDRLSDKLIFYNAVFQVDRKEEKPISYLLGYSKYSARSDDRQEGIVGCLVNELNLSVQKTTSDILDLVPNETAEPIGQAERESSERVLKAFWQAQLKIVKETLSDFLISMERRMNRDIRRVHDYYQTLIYEHRQALAKKLADRDENERGKSKIEAIERELKGKVQDLIGKFSIDLLLEPISFVRIETMSPIFWLSVKRRKDARQFPLTYNPIVKSLDPLPCEACFYPGKGYYVCDDRLHILCRECFAPCARCDKIYCSACHPKGCPKCGS
ncbi:MAG TPA: hypothetical protein VGW77_28320 [Candidatus Binatia bacterium]|nr:hypothetical protein [Candidatus Binatia bacterium]